MATMQQLEQALINAHNAGDTKAAEKLAAVIVTARQDPSNLIPGNEVPGTTAKKPEPTLGEQIVGAGETALTIGTGATGGTVGLLGGTAKGLWETITSGKYGTSEGADIVEQEAMKGAQALTYAPRTQAGQAQAKAVGEFAQQAIPVAPLTAEMNMLASGVRQAAPVMRGVRRTQPQAAASDAVLRRAAQQQALKEAEMQGVPVMTSDIRPPRTFAGKWAQSTGERIPLAGTGGMRQAQQAKRVAAVRNVLRDYGADDAAGASDAVMADLSRQRGTALTNYSQMKGDVIKRLGDVGEVPVTNTLSAIDKQIAKLKGLKSQEYTPVIAKLEDWKQALKGQNLTNIEDLRKQMGESFKSAELAGVRSKGEAALSSIYGPLREDMGKFIKQYGERRDLTKWQVANKRLSELAGELKNNTLKSTLKRGDATPEVVKSLLFSKKPSEIRVLYKNLSPQGRAHARAAILSRAAEKAIKGGDISPEVFANEVRRLGDSVGIFFTGKDQQALGSLMRVLQMTKRASEASVAPPTGVQVAIPVGAAVLTDLLGGAGKATTAGISIGLLSRIYESPGMRNLLLKLPKTAKGSAAEAAVVQEIMAAIAKEAEKK